MALYEKIDEITISMPYIDRSGNALMNIQNVTSEIHRLCSLENCIVAYGET